MGFMDSQRIREKELELAATELGFCNAIMAAAVIAYELGDERVFGAILEIQKTDVPKLCERFNLLIQAGKKEAENGPARTV